MRLEELNFFKHLSPFQFWDVEEGYRIDSKFEVLNFVKDSVYLIATKNDKGRQSKCFWVGDVLFNGEPIGTIDKLLKVKACPQQPSDTDLGMPL